MRSLKFPNLFNKNTTNVWKASEHKQATMQNCITLFQSERGELFGDPYFGMLFKHYLFDQNNTILADAIVDMIYTQLVLFLPQLKFTRNDIVIFKEVEKGKLYCEFKATDLIDYTINTYQLLLFQLEENNI